TVLLGLSLFLASGYSQQLSWSPGSTVLDSGASSWTRMVHLQDGTWLAAYAVWPGPSKLRVKRSFDHMRTWQFITEVGEPGRDLDNANLLQRGDGIILLSLRSVVL